MKPIPPVLFFLLLMCIPAFAQYGCIPGDAPPLHTSEQLTVEVSPPYQSAFSLPGISDDDAARLEHPAEDEIIYWTEGIRIGCVPHPDGCTYVFMGMWGFNCCECSNVAAVCQLSPSGRYFAVGADGTSVLRGPVYVFDLQTGERYRTTPSEVWECSGWIEGDYLLIESAGTLSSDDDILGSVDLSVLPWVNLSYMTEAAGRTRDFVLYHDGSSWLVMPEDSCYTCVGRGVPVLCERGIFFDVTASQNVIPLQAGISTLTDLQNWIDDMGGDFPAFPYYDFRVYLDIQENRVSKIVPMEPEMVVEGFLYSMRAGDIDGMLDYLSPEQRNLITVSQREEVENALHLFSELEFSIRQISIDEDEAIVDCSVYLPGYPSEYSFGLLRIYGRWLLDSV